MYMAEKSYPKSERAYLVLASAFAVLLVLTNIIGIKLFTAPFYGVTSKLLFFIPQSDLGFALTTGILTYPLTFLVTDVVSEIWGEKRANVMVVIGFLMSILMLAIVQLALHVPGHMFWAAPDNPFGYADAAAYQNAFASVFSVNGKLLFGSMLAYMVAQLLDVKLYHFWRNLTKGKHLWLRNNGSTMVSQFVDTAIVNSILFYWGFGWPFWQGVEVMLTIYFYKMLIAAIDTPLIYLGVALMKKKLVEWGELDEDGNLLEAPATQQT